MTRRALFLGALALTAAACATPGRVVVAAGTTLVDGGLLDRLADRYEESHPGVELSVVGDATAQVLELGRRGAADLLVTHAPTAERAFVADGLSTRYELVFTSRFILVGPPGRAIELADLAVLESLREIARREWPFVSRADGSGTHVKERELWTAAGVSPDGEPWYLETGQGMGLTLQVADQRGAFTLAELGSYLAAAPTLALQPVAGPPQQVLDNPYHALVVRSATGRREAEGFLDWLLGPAGRTAVLELNEELFGELVYDPGLSR